ncbi:MAG: SUMF1/EgtB/PvdO family nonheme iron enzyme [Acidobacteria bacterium]|nr:SUMF1/EgtB/PvdO family nonheme iron enzyme [Acidobacteriota bacterium]
MLRANDEIGPYTLVRQLGRGAFGVVWLAERRGKLATTQVAVKFSIDEEPDIEEITKESHLWATLGKHPNILPIIEAEIYGEYVVVVSEFAPDGSLDSWLKRHGGSAPSVESALRMGVGILLGLEHLHSRDIIHRDLKPANILLQGDTPRLADFGLARMLKATAKTSNIAGTPTYMSPESFDGDRSIQTDIWAVGVMLYQLLTGSLPFDNIGMALMKSILIDEPKPLPDNIPITTREIVSKALQKDPVKRFSSAQEMRQDLENCLFQTNSDTLKQPIELYADLPNLSRSDFEELTANTMTQVEDLNDASSGKPKLFFEFDVLVLEHDGAVRKRYVRQNRYFVEELDQKNYLEMVYIPKGIFLMGSPDYEIGHSSDESPLHEVNIEPFYISKTTITQAQWRVVASWPKVKRKLSLDPSHSKGDKFPVEQVSWEEAMEFCARLSEKTGRVFRLPSEAEWEYACRAGTTTPFSLGDTITTDLVNYNGNMPYAQGPKGVFRRHTVEVANMVVANAFGLFDMHGNVWEWCLDTYQSSYENAPNDGKEWQIESSTGMGWKVLRGGAWNVGSANCRSASRFKLIPDIKPHYVGFRVVVI